MTRCQIRLRKEISQKNTLLRRATSKQGLTGLGSVIAYMRKAALLPMHKASYPIVNLDTITNSVLTRLLKKHPELYRNRAPYILKELLTRFLWTNRFDIYAGNPWDAWTQASHTTLAVKLGLKSREWVCTLVKILREIDWIETFAPRKPDGKQESTTFRPGPMLRQFLKTLLEYKKREKNRVNSTPQVFPSSSFLEPKQTEKQTDSPIPKGFVEGLRDGLVKSMDMNTKTRW